MQPLSPVELEIELFCRGMRIDASCSVGEDGRRIARTRAGLGSGLEIVLPSTPRPLWVNVPVVEAFAKTSPLRLVREGRRYSIQDDRVGETYSVVVPSEPAWYSRTTSSGTPMSRVGVLQGNTLGVYVSSSCLLWAAKPSLACKFCTTGKNMGVAEQGRKKVEAAIEVALCARNESSSIFTHFNTGYQEAASLAAPPGSFCVYEWKLALLRTLAHPYVAWKRRPRAAEGLSCPSTEVPS
jgi:hypothetical protein